MTLNFEMFGTPYIRVSTKRRRPCHQRHRATHQRCLLRNQRHDPPAIWGASEPVAPGGWGSCLPCRNRQTQGGAPRVRFPLPSNHWNIPHPVVASTEGPLLSALGPVATVPPPLPAPRPARHLGGLRTCGPRRVGRVYHAATRTQVQGRRFSLIPDRALTAPSVVSHCVCLVSFCSLSFDHQ